MSDPKRTIVVHVGGIGDFLLCCPALIRLAERGPIELLGQPERLRLAVIAGIASAAHNIDSVGFESGFGEPSRRLKEFLAPFDRAIIWMKDAGEIKTGFRRCGIPDVDAFPGIPHTEWASHATKYYLRCLGFTHSPPLRLPIPPGKRFYDVIIHPGSGSQYKNWPFDLFKALSIDLKAQGRYITWCKGPAEEGIHLPEGDNTLMTPSLEILAGELAASRLYIGNDSGISHLAASLRCQTVLIFGPTDPNIWAPLGSRVTVVHDRPWPDISAVMRAIE